MAQILGRDDDLSIDLRRGHMQRAQRRQPRLRQNLRTLGAVGPPVAVPAPSSRGAVVKAWGANPTTTADHLRYLQVGKGFEGSRALLYSRPGEMVEARSFAKEAATDPHQFRLILALHDGPLVDTMPVVQTWMARVEADLGRPLLWVAATHQDTAHRHAHIVIRGRDARGQELYLFRQYLHAGLRARAREVATEFLGPVPAQDRTQARSRAREVGAFAAQHAEATKKEGTPMIDDHHPTQRDADQYADVPAAPNETKAEGTQTLLQRLEALLQRLAQQRQQAQGKSRGIGI